ncbi:hypothetical protein ADUPG1_000278, partial [Aduncisulcus paluster]
CKFECCAAEKVWSELFLCGEEKERPRPEIVTCYMSIHHMLNPVLVLTSCCKILKEGGYLVLREHDCFSPDFGLFLDIQHGLYSYSLPSKKEEDVTSFIEGFERSYVSESFIDRIAAQEGLLKCSAFGPAGQLSNPSMEQGFDRKGRFSNLGMSFYFVYYKPRKGELQNDPDTIHIKTNYWKYH